MCDKIVSSWHCFAYHFVQCEYNFLDLNLKIGYIYKRSTIAYYGPGEEIL